MTAPIAQLVALLMSTGLSADVVAQAVDLAEQHARCSGGIPPEFRGILVDEVAERRRAYDRERKRLCRPPRNSTGSPRTSKVTATSYLLPEEPLTDSQEKKEVVVEGRKRPARSTRGTRLPADWLPSAADEKMAVDLLGMPRANEELPKFRDWWAAAPGQRGVKLDWNATWRNWVRRAGERAARGPPGNGHAAPGQPLTQRQKTDAALAKLQASIDRDEAIARGEEGGAEAVGLFSARLGE